MTSEPDATPTGAAYPVASPAVAPIADVPPTPGMRRAFVPGRDFAPLVRPVMPAPVPSFVQQNGVAPPVPRLRTAWKRKQDAAAPPPGKTGTRAAAAAAANGRGTSRPGPNGVRAHLPAANGSPQVAPSAPPLPPLSALPPPPPRLRMSGQDGPLTRVSSAPPVPAIPAMGAVGAVRTNPKARPRGTTRFQPGGTILAPAVRRQPGRAGRWFGNVLIAMGLLIAVGAVGTTYFTQRVQQSEQDDFLSSLGPTPTPLTLRATTVAVGIAPGGAGAVLPISRPSSGGITGEQQPTVFPTGTPAAIAALAVPEGGATVSPAATRPALLAIATADIPRVVQPTGAAQQPGAPAVIAGDAVSPDGRRTATAAAMQNPPAPMRVATPTPTAVRRPVMAVPTATPRRMVAPPPQMPPRPTPEPQVVAAVEPTPEAMPMLAPTPEPTPEPEPTAIPVAPRMPVPNRIAIPALGVDSKIVEVGISPIRVEGQDVYIWDVAGYAVGHHFSSGSPGEGENIVLSGHNDWEGEVFRDLWKLGKMKGTRITLWTGERQWSYYVEDVVLLKEVGVPLEQRLSNAQYIAGTGDDRLTLVTCWPYGVDDHRLVVIARPMG